MAHRGSYDSGSSPSSASNGWVGNYAARKLPIPIWHYLNKDLYDIDYPKCNFACDIEFYVCILVSVHCPTPKVAVIVDIVGVTVLGIITVVGAIANPRIVVVPMLGSGGRLSSSLACHAIATTGAQPSEVTRATCKLFLDSLKVGSEGDTPYWMA